MNFVRSGGWPRRGLQDSVRNAPSGKARGVAGPHDKDENSYMSGFSNVSQGASTVENRSKPSLSLWWSVRPDGPWEWLVIIYFASSTGGVRGRRSRPKKFRCGSSSLDITPFFILMVMFGWGAWLFFEHQRTLPCDMSTSTPSRDVEFKQSVAGARSKVCCC